jgi:hypothetical protein
MCDDNNVCTIDSCDPELGCVYDYISCDNMEVCDYVLGCVESDVSIETIILEE